MWTRTLAQVISETRNGTGKVGVKSAGRVMAVLILAAGSAGFLGHTGVDAAGFSTSAATTIATRSAPPVSASLQATTTGGHVILLPAVKVMMVEAGATGQGVDQATCDKLAQNINQQISLAGKARSEGQYVEADVWQQGVESAIDWAMDQGCFIVY